MGDDEAEVPLRVWGSAEQLSRAPRRARVVYREAGPWSPAVLALPRHLEREGFAGAPRVLAQATWLNAQLHDDDVAEPHGLPSLADRARQARLILDGYGLPARGRRSASWMLTNRSVLQRAIG